MLRRAGGVQWPYPEDAHSSIERLYADGRFPTGAAECQSYGHDLLTGALHEAEEYAAHDPSGRAFLKAAEYLPPHDALDDDHPLRLTTGRTVHHWHTRTKTARAQELQGAAPEMWLEIYPEDAADLMADDWSQAADALTALAHPVRLMLLREILAGAHGTAELAAHERLGTTGQLYHHLRQLVAAGWLRTTARGQYAVPGERVVPILTILAATRR